MYVFDSLDLCVSLLLVFILTNSIFWKYIRFVWLHLFLYIYNCISYRNSMLVLLLESVQMMGLLQTAWIKARLLYYCVQGNLPCYPHLWSEFKQQHWMAFDTFYAAHVGKEIYNSLHSLVSHTQHLSSAQHSNSISSLLSHSPFL